MSRLQSRRQHAVRVLVVIGIIVLTIGASSVAAVPASDDTENDTRLPPDPDHGIAPATFDRLWARAPVESHPSSTATEPTAIVDNTFQQPPAAAAQWTAGEHGEFPTTGPATAVVPRAATPIDTPWLRDAHLTLFAIQPSTVTHIAPNTTPRHVRATGTVRGVADYRVVPPANHTIRHRTAPPEPGETVLVQTVHEWALTDHEFGAVVLRADGRRIATTAGGHRPELAYTKLPEDTATLTLQTTVSVTLSHTIRRQYRQATRVCDSDGTNDTDRDCRVAYATYWRTTTRTPTRETTLTDTVAVTVAEMAPTVTRMRFADGTIALTIDRGEGAPWARAMIPGVGTLHSPWHFNSAARPGWTELTVHTATGTRYRQSDAIPLQVHAFPSTGGAYLEGRQSQPLSTIRLHGPSRAAPQLPLSVTVPVARESYRAAAVTIRTDRPLPGPERVRIAGLVRGPTQPPAAVAIRRQRRTELSLTVLAVTRSTETARVQVSLTTAAGRPIDLRDRPGVVRLQNATLTPDADGTATATVPLGTDVLTARYDPGYWADTDPAYAPARATATLPATWPAPVRILGAAVRLLLVLAPLLLGIYLLDRLSGRGRLWPPWRGLE